MREASKIPVRLTENNYSTSPVSLINTKTTRLLSAVSYDQTSIVL